MNKSATAGTCTYNVRMSLFLYFSTWRLIHKGTTPFGPTLTVMVLLEKPPSPSPSPPPPPPSAPQFPPLTNENLLKSIGFLPSEERKGEEECVTLTPSNEVSDPQEGATEDRGSSESPSEQMLHAFELVDKPSASIISLSSTDSLQHLTLSPNEEGTYMYVYIIQVYMYMSAMIPQLLARFANG